MSLDIEGIENAIRQIDTVLLPLEELLIIMLAHMDKGEQDLCSTISMELCKTLSEARLPVATAATVAGLILQTTLKQVREAFAEMANE